VSIVATSKPVRPTIEHEQPTRMVTLTERERRAYHRLIHRCKSGKRDRTDALLGWLDLKLGCRAR
jgi:hypothetical protein